MKKLTITLITLSVIILSCNKIDTAKEVFEIILPVEVNPWDPDYAQTVIQKIYVEEFTGHLCTYCPAGARELQAIMKEDPTIIATAIHCSSLANSGAPPYFDKNYKTPMGDQISNDFNISGLPKAMINRIENSPNEWGVDRIKWRNIIESIDRNNVRAGIQLQCRVDEVKQEIEAQVTVTIIKELPNPVQICLVLQQDSIISGQVDGNQYIIDYSHNHMLRTGFKGNYGTKLSPNGIVKAQSKYTTTFKISYKNPFPFSNLLVELRHCSVVAYLIDLVTKEVVQVECAFLE